MKKRNAEDELLEELEQERLPGKVKSNWALKYKLEQDQNIEKALNFRRVIHEKSKTKGRFNI